MFQHTISPKNAQDEETSLAIEFSGGIPISAVNLSDGTSVSGSVALLTYLNGLGSQHGIEESTSSKIDL